MDFERRLKPVMQYDILYADIECVFGKNEDTKEILQ